MHEHCLMPQMLHSQAVPQLAEGEAQCNSLQQVWLAVPVRSVIVKEHIQPLLHS